MPFLCFIVLEIQIDISQDDDPNSDFQSDFDSEEEFGYRSTNRKGSKKQSVPTSTPKGSKGSKNPGKQSSVTDPKTPAQKKSRENKARAPKPKREMPAAANLKVNTTHHPFISMLIYIA